MVLLLLLLRVLDHTIAVWLPETASKQMLQ